MWYHKTLYKINLNGTFSNHYKKLKQRSKPLKEINQVIVFKLSNEFYGVPIQQVKEIIKMFKPIQLPQTSEFIEGIINLRGKIYTILNLCKRFKMKEKEAAEETKIIIINEKSLGFVVDDVNEIIRIEKNSIESAENLAIKLDKKYILGIAKHKDKIIVLLNLCSLLEDEEEQELEGLAV